MQPLNLTNAYKIHITNGPNNELVEVIDPVLLKAIFNLWIDIRDRIFIIEYAPEGYKAIEENGKTILVSKNDAA